MPVYSNTPGNTPATGRMSVEEFTLLTDANWNHELIDGIMVNNPAPTTLHQRMVYRLARMVDRSARKGEVFIAPTSLVMDDFNFFAPDVVWVASVNKQIVDTGTVLRGIPDVIIEVVTPGTAYRDRGIKFKKYEQFGVREYWIADPLVQTIEVFRYDGIARRFVQSGVYRKEDRLMSMIAKTTLGLTDVFPFSLDDDTRPFR
jgi:Uma2 family endonuclease